MGRQNRLDYSSLMLKILKLRTEMQKNTEQLERLGSEIGDLSKTTQRGNETLVALSNSTRSIETLTAHIDKTGEQTLRV